MATIRRDDCCALGKWIYGAGGQRYGQLPLFSQLVEQHKTFHLETGRIAELVNAGKTEEANRLLQGESPFIRAGRAVVNTLNRLKQAVAGAAKSARIAQGVAAARPALPAGTAPAPAASGSAAAAAAQAKAGSAAQRTAAPAAAGPADGEWETF